MANRAIKYRVYPTTEQSVMFAKTFGCCRKVWNLINVFQMDWAQHPDIRKCDGQRQMHVSASFATCFSAVAAKKMLDFLVRL